MTAGGADRRRHFPVGILVALLSVCALAGTPSAAVAETRGYVISMIHTATYGDTDTCPRGSNGGPIEIKTGRLVAQGYSVEEARRIIANDGVDDDGNKVQITEPVSLDEYEVNPAHPALPGTRPADSHRGGSLRPRLQSRRPRRA